MLRGRRLIFRDQAVDSLHELLQIEWFAYLRGATGTTNQKVLPLPTALSNPIRPPWASMASLQKVRPNPVEAILPALRASTCPNF